MKFIDKIEEICKEYDKAACGRLDKADIFGIIEDNPSWAEHIVFDPMPPKVQTLLLSNYKRTFPKELLSLYQKMNGADLFRVLRTYSAGKKTFKIPLSCFSIYGIPLTNDRKHIEPYNISLEDTSRPEETPDTWLKFGSYYRPGDFRRRLDLFIDTDSGTCYAVEHEEKNCMVAAQWESLDECLCAVVDRLNTYDSLGFRQSAVATTH